MAGLNLNVGGFGGYGGVSTTPSASWGSSTSYENVSSAAFGPGVTVEGPSASSVLAPNDPFGVAFWLGVASVAALVFIRYSLPN